MASPEPCCTSDWGRQKKQALCVDGKERREASFFTALFSCSPQEAAAIGSSLSRQTSTFTHTHTHSVPSSIATLINSQCVVRGDNISTMVRGKGLQSAGCDSSLLHTDALSPPRVCVRVCESESRSIV